MGLRNQLSLLIPKSRRIWIRRVVVSALAAFLAWVAWPIGNSRFLPELPLKVVERISYDAMMSLNANSEKDRQVVVVGFDTQTEQKIGAAWPPSRSVLAKAISKLSAVGAAKIGVDILLEGSSGDPKADHDLDTVLKSTKNVVLACRMDRDLDHQSDRIALIAPYFNDSLGIDYEATTTLGLSEVPLDEDRVFRQHQLSTTHLDEKIPSFATALAGSTKEMAHINIRFNSKVTTDMVGPDLAEVASGNFRIDTFRGKIVLIGLTGTQQTKELNDSVVISPTRLTPWSIGSANRREIPGVYLQALITEALINQSTIKPLPTAWRTIIAAALAWLLLCIGDAKRKWRSTLTIIGVATASLLAAWLAFSTKGVYIPVLSILALCFAAVPIFGWLDHELIRKAWGRYLSPGMLAELNHEGITTTPARCQASVLFIDIRGFTQASQAWEPNRTLDFLNHVNSQIVPIIHARKGIVDKFLGDGIMAVFGVPTALNASPHDAIETALAIQKLNIDGVTLACGIATGEVVAGHVHGGGRYEFTVIGSVVNLAARLQSELPNGGILIDAETSRRTGLTDSWQETVLKIKGFDEEVSAYLAPTVKV